MAQLRQDYPEFVRRGAEVLAIGPDDAKAFQEYWEKEDMPFPGLADPDHKVADEYGQEVNLLKLGRMPAQFVVDKHGRIRYEHKGFSMSDIPSSKDLLDVLDEANADTMTPTR